MKCQRCGSDIERVAPYEQNPIEDRDDTIHTIKTEKIVNGVIVDFRIFFVCEKCWESVIYKIPVVDLPEEAKKSIVVGEHLKTEY